MAIGPFKGYSVFDFLMRESISKQRALDRMRSARVRPSVPTTPGTQTTGVSSDRALEIATGTAGYQASGANQPGGMQQQFGTFGSSPTGGSYSAFAGAESGTYGMLDGEVVDVSADPSLATREGFEPLTAGEAAVKSPVSSRGLSQYGTLGKVGLGVVGAMDPSPFGFITSLMGGSNVVDPYGKKAAVPNGILGFVARQNIERQYDVAEKIKQGTPGYHQFYSRGQLVSIVPQTILGKQVGYGLLGTTDLTSDEAIAQYSTMFGYDPSTVDMSKRPGDPGFGESLSGFVPGVGGVGVDGTFVDTMGNRQSQPRDTAAYVGMLNDFYGTDYAYQQGLAMGLDENTLDDIYTGRFESKAYYNTDGSVAGYATGTGGIVTDKNGNPVTSRDGTPVSYGTGYMTPDTYDAMQESAAAASTYDTTVGSQQTQMLAEQDRDFGDDDNGTSPSSSVSVDNDEPGDYMGGADEARASSRDNDDNDNDRGSGGDRDASGDTSGGRGSDPSGGASGSPFADGGFVTRKPMQEGGEAEVPVAENAGFVEQAPEQVSEADTVADDVELDVPEGTFILNAAAVEFMGSADVKKMILEAMDEAEKQGIDIEQENSTIPKENLVSLVVSKGEVIVPPQLAQIIGYDRLNKINNRGKAEVQKRIEENGQADQPSQNPQEPPIVQAAEGADTRGMLDLEDVYNYRSFKNPQSSFLNWLETTGAFATGSVDEMEKAYSYSRNWNEMNKAGDEYEDTMRHALLGGLYPSTAGMYADLKEQYHKYAEAYPKIGYEKAKGMLGLGEPDPEQIEIAQKIIAESDVDLNNNEFGRELRKRIPDEKEYVRTLERMINIAVDEGIDKVPALTTEDGKEVRLQLSTIRQEMRMGGETSNDPLKEIGEDLFGYYKRIAERPEPELSPELMGVLNKILETGLAPNRNIMSETDIGAGSTEKQRQTTFSVGMLTPQNAQALYMEMPSLYKLAEGRDDPQAIEALRSMEALLKEQIGDNVPKQNAPREIQNVNVSQAFTDLIKKIEAPKTRTVSKTVVNDSGGFISKSY